MNDFKQRPLAVGDRITIPATILSVDGGLIVTPVLPDGKGDKLPVQPNSVLRCMKGDNNGIDDHILGDLQAQIKEHYDNELVSFQNAHAKRLAELDKEYATAQTVHAQRTTALDAEFEIAKAKHIGRMAAVTPA